MVWMIIFAVGHYKRLGPVKGESAVRFISLNDKNGIFVGWTYASSHREIASFSANGPFDVFAKCSKQFSGECRGGGLAVRTTHCDGIAVANNFRKGFATEHYAPGGCGDLRVLARHRRSDNHKICICYMIDIMSNMHRHTL